jgi:hypothetical protein
LEAPVSRPLPVAWICVVYWCKGEVFDEAGELVTDEAQIKLRPRVVNDGSKPLDVRLSSPSSILLLVDDAKAGERWNPPPLTRAAGDKPRRVSVNGQTYWGLPPNVNNDFRPVPGGLYDGFGSTWRISSVAPGSSYLETARNADGSLVHNGNLVFQVPLSEGDMHLIGLALIDRKTGKVVSFQSSKDWGQKSEPSSF